MCGIGGFLFPNQTHLNVESELKKISEKLERRGPDASGYWIQSSAGVAFCHRRLSILDPSSAGHQPMTSRAGRWTIVFNGEIYNHLDLRRELRNLGVDFWSSSSDTETLLEALDFWGIDDCLQRLDGMFAFAAFHHTSNKLFLARDRLGEKPLYYGQLKGHFFFASDLSAMEAMSLWEGEIDREALRLYMRYGHVPAPKTIYLNFSKIPPGCSLEILSPGEPTPPPKSYWDPKKNRILEREKYRTMGESHARNATKKVLRESVESRLRSDFPVGAFLSGGIDSSLIVALASEVSTRPVKTFSIGFETENHDESIFARRVASHLGTEHTELIVSAQDAQMMIPVIPEIYSEPFADSSQIPTVMVSKLARKSVKVVMSGDGGDELFGGYNRHIWANKLWACSRFLPRQLRTPLTKTLLKHNGISQTALTKIIQISDLKPKISKVSLAMSARTREEFYDLLKSQWHCNPVIGPDLISLPTNNDKEFCESFTEFMLMQDMTTYLPDDILVKLDRASMSFGLEARAPFLGSKVVNHAINLPLKYKIRGNQGKWVLRQILSEYIPAKLFDRPKQGFGIPLGEWLRGPLREWAESLLDENEIRSNGFFHFDQIKTTWDFHLKGGFGQENDLWNFFVFQQWLQTRK